MLVLKSIHTSEPKSILCSIATTHILNGGQCDQLEIKERRYNCPKACQVAKRAKFGPNESLPKCDECNLKRQQFHLNASQLIYLS